LSETWNQRAFNLKVIDSVRRQERIRVYKQEEKEV
jgi:hypothetical protein